MSKGSNFERSFCRQLSLWWTGGKNDSVFWRTSNSGGRATTLAKAGKAIKVHCGDICAIDPVGQPLMDFVTIEIKRGYNRVSLHDLIDKPKKGAKQIWEQWIEQARRSSEQAGTPHWMIVHKRDRREAIVLMPDKTFWAFGLNGTSQVMTLGDLQDGILWMMSLAGLFRTIPNKIKERKDVGQAD